MNDKEKAARAQHDREVAQLADFNYGHLEVGAAVRGEAVAEMNLAAAILSIPVEVPFEHQGISQRKAYMAGAEEVRAKAAAKVSARAADAPSEPSELHRRVCDVLEGLEGMTLPGALPARVAKLRAAVAAFESGVAADALDSQPTSFDLGSSKQYRQQMAGISCAAHGHWKQGDSIHPDYDKMPLRDVARLYAKYAALLANSQPTEPAIAPKGLFSAMGLPDVGLPKLLRAERDDALADAAGIADGWDTGAPDGAQIADAIRSRISSQPTDGGVRNDIQN